MEFLHIISICSDEICWAYFEDFIRQLTDKTNSITNEVFSEKLKYTHTFAHSGVVRNATWTFASTIANNGVTDSGKYAYEFIIGTDGIIQIGWANQDFIFNELGGWGIGDDLNSYGYDGNRKRKWHGNTAGDYSYGRYWSPSDILTCLLDLDAGTISFALNGTYLGIAFDNIDKTKLWYPAASFTENQHGEFKFGTVLDKLFHLPDGYQILQPEKLLSYEGSIANTTGALNLIIPEQKFKLEIISFYYEVTILFPRNSVVEHFQVGIFSQYGDIFVLIVDYKRCQGYILSGKADTEITNDTLNDLIENKEIGNARLINTIKFAKIQDGDIFGVGIHQNQNFVFFTHNGAVVGFVIPVDFQFATPFIRNMEHYKLNFGRSDFKTTEGNTLFSPTKLTGHQIE